MSVYEMQIIFIERRERRQAMGKEKMEKYDKWFAFIFLRLMKNEITKRGKKAHKLSYKRRMKN